MGNAVGKAVVMAIGQVIGNAVEELRKEKKRCWLRSRNLGMPTGEKVSRGFRINGR